jgi:hypothetical protein
LQRKKNREAKAAAANPSDNVSNREFTFIADYTSNGTLYGIRRKETNGLDFLNYTIAVFMKQIIGLSL